MPLSQIILITGGVRSGKSQRAEHLARASEGKVSYVATCMTTQLDAEMQSRIERHRNQRPLDWETVENEFELDTVFASRKERIVLLDCLTLWISYWQLQKEPPEKIFDRLEQALKKAPKKLIIVSNEVGMGLVPVVDSGRYFRDLVGQANQLVAKMADRVEFIVAGLPLILKSNL